MPKSTHIRGIAAKSLDGHWCAAEELRLSDLPEEIAQQVQFDQKEHGWRFQYENFLFVHLTSVTALVGIAKNCVDSKTTFFILLLNNSKKERDSLLFVSPLEDVDFAILNVFDKNTIRIGFCDACDHIVGLRLKRKKFFWVDFPLGDGDIVETPVRKKK